MDEVPLPLVELLVERLHEGGRVTRAYVMRQAKPLDVADAIPFASCLKHFVNGLALRSDVGQFRQGLSVDQPRFRIRLNDQAIDRTVAAGRVFEKRISFA